MPFVKAHHDDEGGKKENRGGRETEPASPCTHTQKKRLAEKRMTRFLQHVMTSALPTRT